MASVEEARQLLEALGMPPAQHNQMAGMTLLALCGLTPETTWAQAERRRCTVTKGIMEHLERHYDAAYAPNTRETFRRQVLHQFLQAGIAELNPFEPDLPTNSPRAHYALSEPALDALRHYGSENWNSALDHFRRNQPALAERYARDRARNMVPVRLPDGQTLQLSPGEHNELQRAVLEEFAPRFAPGAYLLYLGDTAQKKLHVDAERLAELNLPIDDHGKLPDIVLYDEDREWVFLVEAVTSHGPISPSRMVDLEAMTAACPAGVVYVSAFGDLGEFRKHMGNIAWETEVWLGDAPDHMIHYNGERFLGPRPQN